MSTQQWLWGALGVQLVLGAITWWPRGASERSAEPLVAGEITEITLGDNGESSEEVTLKREADDWRVVSAFDYPADKGKVDAMISSLEGVTLRAPVATRATSHVALGVDDEGANRRVRLVAGGQQQELLLGGATSKMAYLRRADSEEVYPARGLSIWNLKTHAKDYLPTHPLELQAATLSTLSVDNERGHLSFVRGEDGWTWQGEGVLADPSAVETLARSLGQLRLTEVVGKDPAPAHGLDGGVVVRWTVTEGDQTLPGSLTVGAEEGSGRYVSVGGQPYVLKVASAGLKGLLEADPQELVVPLPEEEP